MTKNEAEAFYHSLMRFGVKPGLDRIKILLERLGNPHKNMKYIHVAGTNGKGSVCTYISSVLQKCGYTVGLYTSPYVIEFSERIRLNGEMIDGDDLARITAAVKNEIEKLNGENIIITEFEAVTAAAFLYYNEKNCDYVVLETGLGGRFDATNVIESNLCSVITSVSLDHTAILGDTTGKIAFEKCGIIKNGCPVVTCSAQDEDALEVIKEQARIKNSDLYIADAENYTLESTDIFSSNITVDGCGITVPFPGVHQIQNCITSLAVFDVLKKQGVNIPENRITDGISCAKIPARCEVICRKPLVILDGCHNEGSSAALKQVICESLKGRDIYAVMGMMADKECEKTAENLVPYFKKVTVTLPSNPRSMNPCEFEKIAKKFCDNTEIVAEPVNAVKKVFSSLKKDDVMIVCGSLYLAADVRETLLKLCIG